MLSFIHGHVLQIGGAVLAALTVSAAAAVDAGAGVETDTSVQTRAEVEAAGAQLDHHTAAQAELALTADLPEVTADPKVEAGASASADVDVDVDVDVENRAEGRIEGGADVSMYAPSLNLSTGLRADFEPDSGASSLAVEGEAGGASLDISPAKLEVAPEAEANVDAGLSLSLDGEQVNAGVTGEVAGGLALR